MIRMRKRKPAGACGVRWMLETLPPILEEIHGIDIRPVRMYLTVR